MPKVLKSTCRKLDVYLHAKKLTSSLTSFFRYCKDITNLLFWELSECLTIPVKIIVPICSKLPCLSAYKKYTSSLISFLRYCKEIVNRAYSRNLGQRSLLARKGTFVWKKGSFFDKKSQKISILPPPPPAPPPYSIPFLSVLHQKCFCFFDSQTQYNKGLEYSLADLLFWVIRACLATHN